MFKNLPSDKYAYVLMCPDPKIRAAIEKTCETEFAGHYFNPAEFGGIKELISPQKESDADHIFRKIETADRVHPLGLLVLINHTNCGAYRLAGHAFASPGEEESFHRNELEKAAIILKNRFPGKEVETHLFDKEKQIFIN